MIIIVKLQNGVFLIIINASPLCLSVYIVLLAFPDDCPALTSFMGATSYRRDIGLEAGVD